MNNELFLTISQFSSSIITCFFNKCLNYIYVVSGCSVQKDRFLEKKLYIEDCTGNFRLTIVWISL